MDYKYEFDYEFDLEKHDAIRIGDDVIMIYYGFPPGRPREPKLGFEAPREIVINRLEIVRPKKKNIRDGKYLRGKVHASR